MGYYTRYSLSWKLTGKDEPIPNCTHKVPQGAAYCPTCGIKVGSVGLSEQVEKEIKRQKEVLSDNFYAIQPDGSGTEACKWYEHEDDMARLSLKFPTVLFELEGEGEESGDIWTKYFLNGKIQVCKARIEREPFDHSKLETKKIGTPSAKTR